MDTTEANPTIDIPSAIPIDTAADVAGQLTSIGVRYAKHPNFIEAAHVAAFISAVAYAMTSDDGVSVDPEAGFNSLEHTCGHHLTAAILILGKRFRHDGLSAEDVVRSIPGYMLGMFE